MSAVRRATLLSLLLCAPLLVLQGGLSPAQAVTLPAPTGLTPSAVTVSSNPVLRWNRVPGASTYTVQVSTSDTFSTTLVSTSTVNNQYVPTIALPTGTLSWRVMANGSDVPNWSQASFTRDAVAVPQPLTPAADEEIQAPTQPATYSWSPVAGATGYDLRVGTDPAFTDPTRYQTYSSLRRASYTSTTLPAAGDYYWQVRATLGTGAISDWSDPRKVTFTLFGQPYDASNPTPANNPDGAVDDTVLDWAPVAGAVKYDVQIALDDQFLTLVRSATVVGSRYSPPGVLANDQYWWRIRPIDAAGHAGGWLPQPSPWAFQRAWADQAHLQWPEDSATISRPDRMFYQWSGVHLASSYQVQVATNPDFTGTVMTCTSVNTTITADTGGCMPTVGTTYYWRVIASDGPAPGGSTPQTNPTASDAEVHTFTYLPQVVTQTSPAPGASVSVPTLRWAPVAGAMTYAVQVWTTGGTSKFSATTYGTSVTPRTALATGTYRWQVLAYSGSGRQISNPTIDVFQPTFTVVAQAAATASSPDPTPLAVFSGPRVPTVTWTPTVGAAKYQVLIKRHENPTWTTAFTTAYPAGETWDTTFLPAGTYDWQVYALNSAGSTVAIGTAGQFTVTDPAQVTGQQAALVGTDLDSGDPTRTCDATLPNTCQNLRQTPVLAWDADPNAGLYKLIISDDPVLTDPSDRQIFVYGTAWTDTATMADANATSGEYWDVISCVTKTICPITGSARYAFNKQGPTVTLQTPADGATGLSDEVPLTWSDWLADPDPGGSATPLTATAPTTEARYYEVQTSTSPAFASVLDDATVDQTTFTSPSRIYPDGPIYWRVRAFDGSGRASAWSQVRQFAVASPSPVPTAPLTGDTLAAGSSFTWDALPLAATYELKVLKNDGTSIDTAPSTSVALSVTGIQQTSYAPTKALPVIAPPAGQSDNYRWFLRRKTVSGGVGPWSTGIPFRVVGEAPVLQSPAAGTVVAPKGSLFTWAPVSGAASYHFENRPVGGSATVITTVAQAFAPTLAVPAGSREWQVEAYDASGNLIGSSGWRAYSAPPLTGSATISGQSHVGGTLTAAVTWQIAGVSNAYQWYRGSTAISGQTGATHTVVSADIGQALTVKVTGSKSGYDPAVLTSNAITGTAALAVQNTALPTITGTTKIGYTLTTSTGSWSPTPTTLSYQWLRNGVAISGQTARTHVVVLSDVGTTLQVRVTATKAGYSNGVATSAGKAIPKIVTTTSAFFVDSTITTTTYPRMTVTVKAPGWANPTGYVRVYEGSTLLKTGTLGSSSGGRITLTLPKRSKGSHYLVAKYAGTSRTAASQSPKVLLTVRVG